MTASLPAGQIRPVVLVDEQLARRDQNDITNRLKHFDKYDDVFTEAFAATFVIHGLQESIEGSDSYQETLAELFPSILFSRTDGNTEALPSGPYFLHGSDIHQAWRLYPDELDAFIYGVIPRDVLSPDAYVARYLGQFLRQGS